MKFFIKDAANFANSSRMPKAFQSIILSIRNIFTFTQERANRLKRCIAIIRSYKSGMLIRDIEIKYGCSRQTILRYARAAGIEKRPKHFPKEIRNAVIKDYKNKIEVAEIARLHNVSPAYVSKIAREEGISRYSPRPKKKKI